MDDIPYIFIFKLNAHLYDIAAAGNVNRPIASLYLRSFISQRNVLSQARC